MTIETAIPALFWGLAGFILVGKLIALGTIYMIWRAIVRKNAPDPAFDQMARALHGPFPPPPAWRRAPDWAVVLLQHKTHPGAFAWADGHVSGARLLLPDAPGCDTTLQHPAAWRIVSWRPGVGQ